MRQSLTRIALAASATALRVDDAYAVATRLSGIALRRAARRLERATRSVFPDRDDAWVAATVRDQLRHRAWVALDKHTMARAAGDDLVARSEGVADLRALLDRALSEGRGATVYTIHYGRPLLLPVLLAHFGYPFSVLRATEGEGVETILSGRESTGADAMRALDENRVLFLLVDTPLARQTATGAFLGARLPVAVGLAELTRKAGSTLVAATVRSAAPFRFRVEATAVAPAGEEATPDEAATLLVAPFEATVGDDPGAWYGVNRVFRARRGDGGRPDR
jgi:lauroyl/myristoyl acyltransferase